MSTSLSSRISRRFACQLLYALPLAGIAAMPAIAQKVTDPGIAPPELIQAAKKEGTVVFYGGTDESTLQNIAMAFEARYGIRVVYQRLASGPQRERIEQEAASGKTAFDVSQLSDEAWVADAGSRGIWGKLDPVKLPNLAKVPVNLRHDNYVAGGLVALATIYNTQKIALKDVPKTSDDFLNPRWRGRFAIVGPNTGLSVRSGYFVWLEKYGQPGYEKFMRDLFAQKPRVVASGANAVQQVAAGELDFVILASAAFAAEPRSQGAPIAVAYPEPTAVATRTFQMASKPVHPNAAMLFVNWLMSPEGLQLMDGNEQAAPPYGKIPTALELPAGVKFPKPRDVLKESDYILKSFSAVSK